MAHDARAVANHLLDLSDQYSRPLTMLHLQKLLYFTHGRWLARNSEPLIRQSFEAWNYGPVIRLVYEAFRETPSASPITGRAEIFDFETSLSVESRPEFNSSEKYLVEEIFLYYSKITTFHLVDLTHASGGPWDAVFNDKIVAPGDIIDDDLIFQHFQSVDSVHKIH